jgi:hypothetical protein
MKKKQKKQTKAEGRPESLAGSLELKLQGGDYVALVAVGLCAAIPVTTWLTIVLMALGVDRRPAGEGPPSTIAVVVFAVFFMTVMLVLPWLVPILVLRARQPRGTRIEWNEVGVTEWDGPWKRAAIAWTEMQAGRVTWETHLKSRILVDEALQLVGPPPAAAITVWTDRPRGVPNFRRRLCADAARVAALREAVEHHGIALAREPDWLLACDSDRPPHRALTIAGRFGYPLAALGPMLVPVSHAVGVAMGVGAAMLLAARALPSLREVRAIVARGRERTRCAMTVASAPAFDEPAPYRAAGTLPSEDLAASDRAPDRAEDDGRAVADRLKLRAALIEAVVRTGCVVMVVVSTAVAFVTLH